MIQSPYWLTGQPVDAIDVDKYEDIREVFMEIFREEEQKYLTKTEMSVPLSDILEGEWRARTF